MAMTNVTCHVTFTSRYVSGRLHSYRQYIITVTMVSIRVASTSAYMGKSVFALYDGLLCKASASCVGELGSMITSLLCVCVVCTTNSVHCALLHTYACLEVYACDTMSLHVCAYEFTMIVY